MKAKIVPNFILGSYSREAGHWGQFPLSERQHIFRKTLKFLQAPCTSSFLDVFRVRKTQSLYKACEAIGVPLSQPKFITAKPGHRIRVTVSVRVGK